MQKTLQAYTTLLLVKTIILVFLCSLKSILGVLRDMHKYLAKGFFSFKYSLYFRLILLFIKIAMCSNQDDACFDLSVWDCPV